MIRTIEDFLGAYLEHATENISFDVLGGEFFYDNVWGTEKIQMDAGLTRQLERLGIIYAFGGVLVINPMAMRVLERMHTEGLPLTGEAFRREVELSKDLYHADHMGEAAEMESASY